MGNAIKKYSDKNCWMEHVDMHSHPYLINNYMMFPLGFQFKKCNQKVCAIAMQNNNDNNDSHNNNGNNDNDSRNNNGNNNKLKTRKEYHELIE